jgi:hypothetical protein
MAIVGFGGARYHRPMPRPKILMTLSAVLAGLGLLSILGGVALLVASTTVGGSGGTLGGGDGPEKPGFEDGHPVGLYLMTRFWIATGSLEKAVYYFTSDGRVFVDLEDGFSDETLSAHKGKHGTVRVDGNEMIVTWSGGKEERSELEKSGGGFNWNTGLFAPVEPFEKAEHLVGSWEGGNSASFSGSSAATSNALDLRADGTFTGESVTSLRSTSDGSDVSAGSRGDHSGTWKLDGYSLVMQYNDGRTARGITFPFDDEETPVFPDRFYFSGVMYKKR